MKKQVMTLAAAGLFVLGMAASCGSNKGAEADSDTTPEIMEEVETVEVVPTTESEFAPDSTFMGIAGKPVVDKGYTTTASGLKYKVLKEGTGKKPGATDEVTVHYTGLLMDGTQFDSSVDRGEPTSFPLNRVISGWTEGLQLMKEGAVYEFIIPADLAYGERGGGPIPPNSTLYFQVQLYKVGQ